MSTEGSDLSLSWGNLASQSKEQQHSWQNKQPEQNPINPTRFWFPDKRRVRTAETRVLSPLLVSPLHSILTILQCDSSFKWVSGGVTRSIFLFIFFFKGDVCISSEQNPRQVFCGDAAGRWDFMSLLLHNRWDEIQTEVSPRLHKSALQNVECAQVALDKSSLPATANVNYQRVTGLRLHHVFLSACS